MSYALADANFEGGEYYNHALYGPFPPIGLRVCLRASQAVLYRVQHVISKDELMMSIRLFRAGRHFFEEKYRDKIEGECQWAKFMMGREA